MVSEQSTQQSEREIVIVREFDAPRELVWRAWTEPEHVAQWFGPRGFSTRVEELDLRVDGRSRYVMIGPDGTEYPSHGVFLEVVEFERIVTTDEFGEDVKMPDGSAPPSGIIQAYDFADAGNGRTRVTLTISHPDAATRRQHEEMGVVGGWNSTLDCLAEHLAVQPGTSDDIRIVISRVLDAPAELVWDAWTDPKHLSGWFCPEGMTVVSAKTDVRVGGAWRSVMQSPEGEQYIHRGEYREVDRPRRLAFTHAWEKNDIEPPADTLATVTLSEFRGQTTMVFEQVGFATVESGESHRGGWSGAFNNLAAWLAKIE